MYRVRSAKKFRKSYDKLRHSGLKKVVFDELEKVVDMLSRGIVLPANYRDHILQGDYIGHRECHIQSDLLLIYRIEQGELVLVLVNIGSHSDLFK